MYMLVPNQAEACSLMNSRIHAEKQAAVVQHAHGSREPRTMLRVHCIEAPSRIADCSSFSTFSVCKSRAHAEKGRAIEFYSLQELSADCCASLASCVCEGGAPATLDSPQELLPARAWGLLPGFPF